MSRRFAKALLLAEVFIFLVVGWLLWRTPPPMTVDDAIRDLRETDSSARRRLVRLGSHVPLLGVTVTPIEEAHEHAIEFLRNHPQGAASAVPHLIAALTGTNESLALASGGVLVRIGPPAIPSLLETMNSTNVRIRALAVVVLSQIDPRDPAVWNQLLRHMRDPDALIRCVVLCTLGRHVSAIRSAEREFTAALQDDDAAVRFYAAVGLAKIKYERKAILPDVLSGTGSMFYNLYPKTSIDDLTIVRRWLDFEMRDLAYDTLESLAPEQWELGEAMKKLLDPTRPHIAAAAARGLWRETRNPNLVLPALIAIVNSAKGTEAYPAIALLGEMQASAKPAVPALAKLAASTNEICATAHSALEQIDPAAAAAISVSTNGIIITSRWPLPAIGIPATTITNVSIRSKDEPNLESQE
ncbi:MAG: hypothetical protein AB1705_18200 [Verrucomicrobiota bacterium]